MRKVYCFGEALIDFIGTPAGQTLQNTKSFTKKPGGAPANVAVALARLNTPVNFIGKVGSDPFGDFLESVLKDEGVDTSFLKKASDPAHQTSLAFVSLDQNKERHFSFFRSPGADTQLYREELPEKIFDEFSIFHFGSISLINGPTRDCCLRLIDESTQDALISYDPNIRLNLWPSSELCRTTILETMGCADILKLSEDELLFLSQLADFETALEFIRDIFKGILLVSRGAKGARAYLNDHIIDVKAASCNVVDSTGAGDAFLGGFLAAVSRLWKPSGELSSVECESALSLAVMAGSFAVQDYGAMSSLPRWDQINWPGPVHD